MTPNEEVITTNHRITTSEMQVGVQGNPPCYNALMDFRWQDVDPDIRLLAIVGIPLIVLGFLFKGCIGPEPVPFL